VSLHLPNGREGIHIPELEGASSAAAEQNWSIRHQAKSTHPVFMSIRNLLKKRRQARLNRAAKTSRGTSAEMEKSQVLSLIPVLQQIRYMVLGISQPCAFSSLRARRVLPPMRLHLYYKFFALC